MNFKKLYLGLNLILCIAICVSTSSEKNSSLSGDFSNKQNVWEHNDILPNDTKPLHYDLFLDPYIEEGTFYGKVAIQIEVGAPRDLIILHTKSLNITSTQLFNSNHTAIPIRYAFEYEAHEFWVVELQSNITPGIYILKLDFNGSLTNGIVGFYRSSYTRKNGTIRHIVSTKFEPTYARRAFPCFDEPSYKATFTIKLVRPAEGGYFALSNMNQISEEENYPSTGKVTVKFGTTPPLATYLACFIICDFEKLPSLTTDTGTLITVYAREGQAVNTKRARDVAVEVMNWFTQYFKIDYPLSKLDLIGIPDFVSGAMENWGLITFRETHLLTSNETSVTDLTNVMGTVAHELAHMWFGDLVTMSWWDDLWLNEGFATFLSTLVLKQIHPEYGVMEDNFLWRLQGVLEDDAAVSSHPVIQLVKKPDQINEMFDSISYSKGSSILRMIEDYAPDGFRNAVSHYLEDFKYGSAHTSDLWAHLVVEIRQIEDVSRMLDTWTKQMGYPLLWAERVDGNLLLEQTRCLTNAKAEFDKASSPFKYKWDIPIKFITSANSTPQSVILKLDQKNVKVQLGESVDWFKVNSKQVGFYRVNYVEKEWMNLKSTLEYNVEVMPPEDRANLIDDAFSLAKSGYLSYNIPLTFINYLSAGQEKHFFPWKVLSKHIYAIKLGLAMGKSNRVEKLKNYVCQLLNNVLKDDNWKIEENATIHEKEYKSTLLRLGCRMKVPSALKAANELFTEWIGGGPKPHIDIREVVYTYGIYDEKLTSNWDDLWELYVVEQDPLEKSMMRTALASVTNPKLLEKLLEFMKNENFVRSQDYFLFMAIMSRNPEGHKVLWEYLKNNWKYLVDRFTLNDRVLGRMVPLIADLFYTPQSFQELNQFIDKNPQAGAGAAGRKRAVEKTKWNIYWCQTYLPIIEKTLDALVK